METSKIIQQSNRLISEKCNCVADLTATEKLSNELLILIRQMHHTEKNMLFIGLTDVINLMEQNLAEFIILAENATHLMIPLDFLTRLVKLAEKKRIPYVYACKKEQLGRACDISPGISVIAIKIGPSYFSEKIKDIKYTIISISRKTNITL